MSANDVVDGPHRPARHLDPIHALDQGAQDGDRLQPGQALTGAGVCAIAETDVPPGVAADVERRRVVPGVLVAIGRGVEHQHPGPGRQGGPGDLAILADPTGERPQR